MTTDTNSPLVLELARMLSEAVQLDSRPEEGGFDIGGGMLGTAVSNLLRALAARINPNHAELKTNTAVQLLSDIRARHQLADIPDSLDGMTVQAAATAWQNIHRDRGFLLTYTNALEKANQSAREEFARNRDTFVNQLTRIQSLAVRNAAVCALLGLETDAAPSEVNKQIQSLRDRETLYLNLLTSYEVQLGIEQDSEMPNTRGLTIGTCIADLKKQIVGLRATKGAMALRRETLPPAEEVETGLESRIYALLMLYKNAEGITKSIFGLLDIPADANGAQVVERVNELRGRRLDAIMQALDEKIVVAALAKQSPDSTARVLQKTLAELHHTDRLERSTDPETGDVVFRYITASAKAEDNFQRTYDQNAERRGQYLSDEAFIQAMGIPKI